MISTLTTRSVILLTTVALVVGACGGAATGANVAPSTLPTAQLAEPTLTPEPTVEASMTLEPSEVPTEAAVAATTEVEADVQVESTTFLYKAAEYARGETDAVLIIKLVNKGTGWAQVDGSSSDYTIYAADGESVLETGDFLYEYPEYLGPGETGYLAQQLRIEESPKKVKGAQVEFDAGWETVDQTDATTYSFAKVKNSWDSVWGMTSKGTVKATGGEAITSGWVGAIYLDAKGKPLGYSWTNLVDHLKPGKPKGFSTVGGGEFPTAKTKKLVKQTVLFGGGW